MIQHGTVRGYTTCKCRCAKCRAANAAYAKEYAHKNKGSNAMATKKYRERLISKRLCHRCRAPYSPGQTTRTCAACVLKINSYRSSGMSKSRSIPSRKSPLLPADHFYLPK